MWTVDLSKVVMPNADLPGYAANKRYEVETAGITLNGNRILTDRASQGMITGAYSFVQANPTTTVNFKTADGFVSLSAEEVTAIANAVGAHVQSCFAAEAAVDAAIAAGTITTTLDIDAAAWPSN